MPYHTATKRLVETLVVVEAKGVTFSDVLKTVRVDLWNDLIFFRKEFSDPSVKIQLHDEEVRHALRNLLAKMLVQAA